MKTKKNPLVGKFFHSVEADKETIKWQGHILAEVASGMFTVMLFDWLVGAEYEERIVPVAEMAHWKLYDSAEEMNNCYYAAAHRERIEDFEAATKDQAAKV
jgi:hypothetical protein